MSTPVHARPQTSSRLTIAALVVATSLVLGALVTTSPRADAIEPGVDVVLIATGANFPDALAGGVLGALELGPLLFVTRETIPPATVTELERLAPQSIVILGGQGVVSVEVERQLAAFTEGPVQRISGSDRFETAARIAQALPDPEPVDAATLGGLGPDAFAPAGELADVVRDGGIADVLRTGDPIEAATLGGLASSAYARAPAPVTRWWTCTGPAMTPEDGDEHTSVPANNSHNYRTSNQTTGLVAFTCPVNLPHGAMPNLLEGVFRDVFPDPTTGLARCFLHRIPLSGPDIGQHTHIGAVATGTVRSDLPIERTQGLSPGSVGFPIDNEAFAYQVHCDLSTSGSVSMASLGVYSASIRYTVREVP